jgi:site-specific recombinase XerC
MLGGVCRLSEIANLNRQDIDWQQGSAKVFGKGSKEREVYFSFKAMYHREKKGTISKIFGAIGGRKWLSEREESVVGTSCFVQFGKLLC